eukprot:Skav231001  [mRNA]  locus=scaffold1822:241431:243891:- [translate_table: standard]
MFYFCNVGSGGAATKVIGRSQTLSVEVGITTAGTSVSSWHATDGIHFLQCACHQLPGIHHPGIFQQWFNLDTKMDPRMPAGDLQSLVTKFEQAHHCTTHFLAFEPFFFHVSSCFNHVVQVQRGSRSTFGIFVGEEVKTQAGPDLKA